MNLLGTRFAPIITTPDITEHGHMGLTYEVSGTGTFAAAGTYVFTGVVGSIPIHFHGFNLTSSAGPVIMKLVESPTISVAGDLVTPMQKNRNSTNVSEMVVRRGATITGGTELGVRMIHAIGGGAYIEGGENAFTGEWILKPNTTYAIIIEADAALTWSASFHWYELEIK